MADGTAPTVSIDPVSNQRPGGPLTITGKGIPGAGVTVDTSWDRPDGDPSRQPITVGPSGDWGTSFTQKPASGTHSVTVTATSADGSSTTTSTPVTVE